MRTEAYRRRESRLGRHERIRKHLAGTAQRPRLCVFRSHAHIYCQIVDDDRGATLVGASSLSAEVAPLRAGRKKLDLSREVGKLIAARARAKGIELVSFDRGGYLYHGRVKALAEGAREGGLKF